MINTTRYELNINPYVLPTQCEHAFYSLVPCRDGCPFVVSFNPRGRPIMYIFPQEYDHEREEEDEAGEKE